MGEKETSRTEKRKSRSKVRKVIFWIFIALVAIAAGIFVAGTFFINGKLNKIDYVDLKDEDIEMNEGVEELKGYRNRAIFGVDARKDTYQGTRSDGIIIASINLETHDVKLISVYRDTYLKIDGHGYDKVTHAYAYGEYKLAVNTLNKNLDLDIKDFVTVNFNALIDIVDEMGGVEIDVEKEAFKQLNQYVLYMHKEMGTPNDQLKNYGKQNLSGVQALAYSRVRYTEGGDYKRTERMRTVLTAIFNKAKKMNIGQLNKLMDIALPRIKTSIDKGEIISLATQLTKYNVQGGIGWPYETGGATINKVWYGVPKDLETDVIKLHQEAFNDEDYTPSNAVKEISATIKKKVAGK